MDIYDSLIEYVVNTDYEQIPDDAVVVVKKDVMDTLAVAVAGSNLAGIRELLKLYSSWGGKPESTVIMSGQRMPAPFAALINSSMVNALDFDDIIPGFAHIGAVILPVGFAISESIGGIDGRKFITAVTLAIDIEYRLGQACRNASQLGPGWLYTPLFGIWGATIIAGKLLNMSKEKMHNALGIAYSQVAGNSQCVIEGMMSKQLQPGFSSQGAIISALMANQGITGPRDIFEGNYGFYRLYHRNDYDASNINKNLGISFATDKLGFKLYPCCAQTHAAIDAALELVTQYQVKPEEIGKITVQVSELAKDLIQPLEKKQQPESPLDAQFSIPWVVATAIVKKRVTMEDFTPKALIDDKVLTISRKIKPEISIAVNNLEVAPAIVTIQLKEPNGKNYSVRKDIAKGYLNKQVTWEELKKKFYSCMLYGNTSISDKKDYLWQSIMDLEHVNDVRDIIQLLC